MGELRAIIVSGILACLFFFAMLSFAYQFSTDNQTTVNLNQDERINSTYASQSLYLADIEEEAQEGRNATESDTPFASGDSLLIRSIFTVGKRFVSLPIDFYNIVFGTLAEVTGIPKMVFNIMMGISILTLALLFWKMLRTGES